MVKHTGSHYLLSELPRWELFPAVVRGRIRLKESGNTNPIAVGDIVDYSIDDAAAEATATIDAIHPRKNYVIRRSTNLSREAHIIAANVDCVYLIVTMQFPEVKLPFVGRFLVTCEAYGVPVNIVVNKRDIDDAYSLALLKVFKEIYHDQAGYNVMEVSAITGENVDLLRESCKGGINLFSGVSGVGKSSLIKAVDPKLEFIRTGEISAAHLQGKHTTTFYEMHPIATGGYIIDTPGIRSFGLIDFKKEELSTYFPEMLAVMDDCRFMPCTHTHEPGCAVKQAVEEGAIAPERYNSYLGMLEDQTKYR